MFFSGGGMLNLAMHPGFNDKFRGFEYRNFYAHVRYRTVEPTTKNGEGKGGTGAQPRPPHNGRRTGGRRGKEARERAGGGDRQGQGKGEPTRTQVNI